MEQEVVESPKVDLREVVEYILIDREGNVARVKRRWGPIGGLFEDNTSGGSFVGRGLPATIRLLARGIYNLTDAKWIFLRGTQQSELPTIHDFLDQRGYESIEAVPKANRLVYGKYKLVLCFFNEESGFFLGSARRGAIAEAEEVRDYDDLGS